MEDNKEYKEVDVDIEEKDVEEKDDFERGLTMLKNALKRYEDNDIEGAEKDRKLANSLLDKGMPEKMETEVDSDEIYTESRNFGIIYNIFENNAKRLFNGKNFKKSTVIKDIIKTIKNDKILQEQFNIYNTLSHKVVEGDTEFYLNEALSLLPTFNKKDVITANNKLIKKIRKGGLDENIKIDETKRNLYEAIEYVILNKKKLNNIEEYNKNRQTIKESIDSNQENSFKNTTNMSKEAYYNQISTIFEKYTNRKNEMEDRLFEEIKNGEGQSVFEKYKTQAIELISEEITKTDNIADKMDWNAVLTKTTLKQYDENKLLEDTHSFISIINLLTE